MAIGLKVGRVRGSLRFCVGLRRGFYSASHLPLTIALSNNLPPPNFSTVQNLLDNKRHGHSKENTKVRTG